VQVTQVTVVITDEADVVLEKGDDELNAIRGYIQDYPLKWEWYQDNPIKLGLCNTKQTI